jgi:hypothetical protein
VYPANVTAWTQPANIKHGPFLACFQPIFNLVASGVRRRRFSFGTSIFLHGSGISVRRSTVRVGHVIAGFLVTASSWTTDYFN